MFTGIVEAAGLVRAISEEGANRHITVSAPFLDELRIDQSVAHNGICLTVVEIYDDAYRVTAIEETLKKTALGTLQAGDVVNLERCMVAGARLDGHIVQGHVDQVGVCVSVQDQNGSWIFTFEYDQQTGNITVEKGSICINGVSLTVVNSLPGRFSVAIIPYTYEHTNFKDLRPGMTVNLEFDIIGKYVARLMQRQA